MTGLIGNSTISWSDFLAALHTCGVTLPSNSDSLTIKINEEGPFAIEIIPVGSSQPISVLRANTCGGGVSVECGANKQATQTKPGHKEEYPFDDGKLNVVDETQICTFEDEEKLVEEMTETMAAQEEVTESSATFPAPAYMPVITSTHDVHESQSANIEGKHASTGNVLVSGHGTQKASPSDSETHLALPPNHSNNLLFLTNTLIFNTLWRLIICTICHGVVLYDQIGNHALVQYTGCTQSLETINGYLRYCVKRSYNNKSHRTDLTASAVLCQVKKVLEQHGIVINQILNYPPGHKKQDFVKSDEAFSTVFNLSQGEQITPYVTPVPRIEGLGTYIGYQCTCGCQMIWNHWKSFVTRHCEPIDGKSKAYKEVHCQSFSTVPPLLRLFPVLDDTLPQPISTNINKPPIRAPDIKNIHPVMQESGVIQFLTSFDLGEIDELIHHAHNRGQWEQLHKLVQSSFQRVARECLNPQTDANNLKILQRTRSGHGLHRQYIPPKEGPSAQSYWRTASDLLYAALQHMQRPIRSISRDRDLFVFSEDQEESLRQLSFILDTKYSPEAGETAVFNALESLFFQPYNDTWQLDKFAAPLLAFFGACLIRPRTDDGPWQFGDFKDGTTRWAKIQSSMRLTMLRKYRLRVLLNITYNADGMSATEWLMTSCKQYLSDDRPSVFAIGRQLFAQWLLQWRSRDHPGKVIYHSGPEDVIIDGQKVNLIRFREAILKDLHNLITLLDHKILMGVPLKEMGIDVDIDGVDNGTTKKSGYSPFAPVHSLQSLGATFITYFVSKRILGLGIDYDGSYFADSKQVVTWTMNVKQATLSLCRLLHFLCGKAPKGEEVIAWSNSNSPQGGRNSFIRSPMTNAQALLLTISDPKSNCKQQIKRWYPRVLTELYWIMTAVIRPAESILLPLSGKVLNPETFYDTYNNNFLVRDGEPFKAEDVSHAIRHFFTSHMGVSIGLRTYDHISTFIESRFARDESTTSNQRLMNLLLSIVEGQAGRTASVGINHYGKPVQEGVLNTPDTKTAFDICKRYHDYFGVPTFKTLRSFRADVAGAGGCE